VFARSDEAWAWLDAFLDVETLRHLLPETAPLRVERYRLRRSARSTSFIHDLLQEGVAARPSGRPAKGLGEWLRSRVVDVPRSCSGRERGRRREAERTKRRCARIHHLTPKTQFTNRLQRQFSTCV